MVKIGVFDMSKGPAVVAVISHCPVEQAREAFLQGADVLEIRLDLLDIKDTISALEMIADLKKEVKLPCIATNRLPIDGGRWKGPEEKRIQLLLDILPVVDAVDVELIAAADLKEKLISDAHGLGKTVIVSHHDFNGTPPMKKIKDILEMAWQSGGDIAKIAVKANSSADTMNLLRATHEATRPVCMISMGDLGKHTRVIAPFYGSVLTYGSVGDAVAPGQLNIAELKRAMKVLL
ncbi:MAG: type I 3-dehydroquinate dehydratase [Methanomethylovorans sp.]|uniref:type I 3-dehydroquinate dehydratase n=1 Tax=Methanomethylovorans sp. TaxID=2758717 RepID=UPI000A46EE10|nr:type I 3-dehydroquinate dehydratase [Methanomethylovorans sp.]